ncbi:hypothetical protein [Streptomyces olivaceus]|uniref:hypothetical protein n=1 Tax=Streptomyces olivaceus TaxID=47716 RepID=UPI001884D214|nr:hypothetical protein [Streptomyces olivaceus]
MSFSPVKALIDVTDRSRWRREALIGLKLISPDDPACSGIDSEASLTDAAQAQDRIRFFLKDRLIRNFRDVGRAWLSAVGPCVVEVTRAELLDEGSRLFLETLATLPGRDVEVRLQVGAGVSAATAHPPRAPGKTPSTACSPGSVPCRSPTWTTCTNKQWNT